MATNEKRTPAEEARAVIEENAGLCHGQCRCRTAGNPATLHARLTPVFERAQAHDGPCVVESLMDSCKALRERAERAEAKYDSATLRRKDAEERLKRAEAERDKYLWQIDNCKKAAVAARDERDELRIALNVALRDYRESADDLARLRVREAQLREALRQLRDEHVQVYAGAKLGLITVGTNMADRLLRETPPDAPDVLAAVREFSWCFTTMHDNGCNQNFTGTHSPACGRRTVALATLRAAKVIE